MWLSRLVLKGQEHVTEFLTLGVHLRACRFENFKNASELKPVNVDAKAGEAGYDPFSRRWTRSQNYYQSEKPKTEKETVEGIEGTLDNSCVMMK